MTTSKNTETRTKGSPGEIVRFAQGTAVEWWSSGQGTTKKKVGEVIQFIPSGGSVRNPQEIDGLVENVTGQNYLTSRAMFDSIYALRGDRYLVKVPTKKSFQYYLPYASVVRACENNVRT